MNLILDGNIQFDCLHLYSRSLHQKMYQFLKQIIELQIPLEQAKELFEIANEFNEWDAEILLKSISEDDQNDRTEYRTGYFEDNIDDLIDPAEHDNEQRNFVIFDDLIDDKQTQLSKYFTRGRHNNINTLYISQSYFHLPRKTIRNNCTLLILFKLSVRDLTNIWHDIVSCDMPLDEFKDFCHSAFEDDYGYIVIDKAQNDIMFKYRTGLTSYYIPNKIYDKLIN